MSTENRNEVGAVLVVGGGIAGIQASLDLANAGFLVYLVEKAPAIGGVMPQLDKTFPTNDCSMCILSPKLVELAPQYRNPGPGGDDRTQRVPGAFHGQGFQGICPVHRPQKMHRLRGLRPEMSEKSQG